jgi:hypothetical protein
MAWCLISKAQGQLYLTASTHSYSNMKISKNVLKEFKNILENTCINLAISFLIIKVKGQGQNVNVP